MLRRIRFSRWVSGPNHQERARTRLRELYLTLNQFLQDLEVDYWLAYGTLLGYHRESDLILGDHDIDVALLARDYQKVKDFQHRLPAGFHLVDTSAQHGGPKLYLRHGLFAADLYFYEERDQHLRLYLRSHLIADRTPVPKDLILPTRPARFLGQATRVPNQVEELLKWTYGYLGPDGRQDPETGFWLPPHSTSSNSN